MKYWYVLQKVTEETMTTVFREEEDNTVSAYHYNWKHWKTTGCKTYEEFVSNYNDNIIFLHISPTCSTFAELFDVAMADPRVNRIRLTELL